MLRRLARLRPRRLGLRARIRLSFALGAFFLSVLLAGFTYAFTLAATPAIHRALADLLRGAGAADA